MSSEPFQDSGAHRIKRKPPPPFPYSARYPEPDPTDPFAPLSVLRDRTATLTNSAYESPISVIQDPAPGASKVHDLATFIVHQRKNTTSPGLQFGENRWLGHASQLRKGASLGLGLHENSSSEAPTTNAIALTTPRPGGRETRRRESRRRSQSVFALRSGAFSFWESRGALEPQSNVDSPVSRRHSLLPYDSSTSVLTSSSTSSGESTHGVRQASKAPVRPRSCSSSFVTAALLDGVPEFSGDAVPVHKSMHVMQVDLPTPQVVEERSECPPSRTLSPPPFLEKRTPSESSISSWSRDLAFYSATSRPQTPSSIQSSRPTSLPASVALTLPFAPVALSPASPPQTSSSHQNAPTVATSLPPSISNSRRVSTPPENLDALPLQLNFRFPKQQRCVESEPESVERENGRFARLRALTSTGSQRQRISASSSLRSTLQAAADAADRLASQDASIHALPPAVTQAQAIVAENLVTSPVAETAPEWKEREVDQRAQVQPGSQACAAERHSRAASPVPHQNVDNVPPASRNQSVASARPTPSKPVPKPESETTPALKHRSLSRSSQRCSSRRSTSTPLPISRPLPSTPTVTAHPNPEPVAKSPPTPPPRANGHGLTRTQVQHAASTSTHSVVHAAPSTPSHTGLPAGAAAPRAPCALPPTPQSAHPFPPAQASNLPPPPPPRAAHTIPLPSRMAHASASSVVQSASSSSSHVDNMSTASAPQLRRRDGSPSSSSHGRHSPHISERHHHHHHGHHPYHLAHPRSLSEPGPSGMLSSTQLAHAARMQVVRENGVRVQFGELWRTQRTVVIFIRHFWCPLCQDYLTSLMRDGDHAALSRSGVRLIVIGCGSYGLIRSYRQIFRLPYELYVDASPGQALYRALGMGQAPSGAHKTRPPRLRASRRDRTCDTAP
ncbi:hypothetical protein EDB85DRAFT_1364457 [Lactarius pseudohatsudake]|nr:hypothetical protein EDB85DRAFT_1364457 [Lactarius pseudohatsudake]